jgi:hypothetical protein
MIGSFESAVWAMLRVWSVVEAAVGKGSAQPFKTTSTMSASGCSEQIVKQDDFNNEVAASGCGEQVDDILDGLVSAMIGSFESAVWAMLRVWSVVEAAVGKGSAQPFVEEQK